MHRSRQRLQHWTLPRGSRSHLRGVLAGLARWAVASTTWAGCGDPHVAGESEGIGQVDKLDEAGQLTRVRQGSDCPPIPGRRPAGLVAAEPVASASALGRWLARAAHFEAASVPAFERLARELSTLGVPGVLVVAAQRACADELRHAQLAA